MDLHSLFRLWTTSASIASNRFPREECRRERERERKDGKSKLDDIASRCRKKGTGVLRRQSFVDQSHAQMRSVALVWQREGGNCFIGNFLPLDLSLLSQRSERKFARESPTLPPPACLIRRRRRRRRRRTGWRARQLQCERTNGIKNTKKVELDRGFYRRC